MSSKEVRRQFFAAVSANLIGFSFAWSCSWANVNYIHLQSKGVDLQAGAISSDEANIMMSLVCAGGLLGNVVYLFVLAKFGRKSALLFLIIPTILSYLLIIFATSATWFYLSRIFTGFVGGATFISVPVFVAEICSDSVRGTVNALGFLINSLGGLAGFIAAIFLDFRMQAVYAVSIPLLFAATFFFVPESPQFLYAKKRIEMAEISLEYYKGTKTSLESEKMMTDKISEKKDRVCLSDFTKTRAARRAVSISLCLVFLPQFCGCFILLSYTTAFFTEAGSSLTPIQSSILICIVQLSATFLTMFLVDRLGRKLLFISSSIGTGIGMLILALHRYYKDELPESNWVPMYGLSITIFIASVGIVPVPFIITCDILPPKIRNITMTITSMIMWTLGFAINLAYLYMLQVIKLYGCLLFFSASCFVCAIYAIFFIPETKGKSHESIIILLDKS